MENEYVLSMEGISKQFPGVRALSNVKLHARKGSVHALMGEMGFRPSQWAFFRPGRHCEVRLVLYQFTRPKPGFDEDQDET